MMTRHGTIRRELYEYLRGGLSPQARESVRRHLDSCPSCTEACRDLESALRILPAEDPPPSAGLPPAYWTAYLERTGERIVPGSRKGARPSIWEELVSSLWPNRRWAVAAGGLAVALGIVALFWRPWLVAPAPPPAIDTEYAHSTADPVRNYLRRSKTLLVGLENMAPTAGIPVDLSPERELSHDLLREARRLREEPLDPGSARAVDDLEKILIEVANLDRRAGSRELELIRSGMQQRNLLFKVRMAEQFRDSLKVRNVRFAF